MDIANLKMIFFFLSGVMICERETSANLLAKLWLYTVKDTVSVDGPTCSPSHDRIYVTLAPADPTLSCRKYNQGLRLYVRSPKTRLHIQSSAE